MLNVRKVDPALVGQVAPPGRARAASSAPVRAVVATSSAPVRARPARAAARTSRVVSSARVRAVVAIVVWIDRRVPEGFTLEDFTVRAAQKWGAGGKQTDNGVVLSRPLA